MSSSSAAALAGAGPRTNPGTLCRSRALASAGVALAAAKVPASADRAAAVSEPGGVYIARRLSRNFFSHNPGPALKAKPSCGSGARWRARRRWRTCNQSRAQQVTGRSMSQPCGVNGLPAVVTTRPRLPAFALFQLPQVSVEGSMGIPCDILRVWLDREDIPTSDFPCDRSHAVPVD